MILETIKIFKNKLLKSGGDHVNEILESLERGLNDYTITWRDKITNVKTYLFSENPVYFDDVYVPLNIKVRSKRINLPRHIDALFRGGNYISIIGHAGSGKTMIMQNCFLRALDNEKYIPIIIELRRLDILKLSLIEYISSVVFKLHYAKEKELVSLMMEQGCFLFFLDGYDEIALESKKQRTQEIEEVADRYFKNLYWLSSRPGAGAENLVRFRSYHVCDMNDDQIKSFVEKQVRYTDEDYVIVIQKILAAIFNAANTNISEYLRNPLLLSMFILTYRYNPEIPKRKSDFYYNVFDTLYIKHDTISKSGTYLHDRKCKFEKDQYLQILRYFSFLSFFNGKYLFDSTYLNRKLSEIKLQYGFEFDNDAMIYDLSVSIGILIKDGLELSFPHRSMQEYFAADLISTYQDDVKKNIIYKEVFKRNFRLDGFNFWSLCEELDELCFQSYFLLKNLREYENVLTKQRNDVSKITHTVFLNMIENAHLLMNVNKNDVHPISTFSIPTLYVSILRYVLPGQHMLRAFFEWSKSNKKEIIPLLGESNKTFGSIVDPLDEPIKSYLLSTSLPDIVYERFLLLKERMEEIDKNIKTKKLQETGLIKLL